MIYDTIGALLFGSVTIAILRRDLIGRMIRGGLVFAAIYILLFTYFLLLYPDFVKRYYNTSHLLGIYVIGIPIEEVLFAWSGGMVWCVIYEYMHGYRLASMRPFRLVKQARQA